MSDSDSQLSQSELLKMEQQKIKKQLKNVAFGDLLKLRNKPQENSQTKQIKAKSHSNFNFNNQVVEKGDARQIRIMKKPLKTKNRTIFENSRPKAIDPRFEDYAGKLDAGLAKKSFSFIEEMQKKQTSELRKKFKSSKIKAEERDILVREYSAIKNQMKNNQVRRIEKEVKGKEKKPNFFLKKKQLKQKVDEAKLMHLNQSGQKKKLRNKTKKINKTNMAQRRKTMT